MSASLLKTKLHIPPLRSEFVPRPHLLERLDEGLRRGCKLILISAPAGYGKSTLLGEWITRRELPPRVAWVSLDESDNDPARFWTYVIASLQTVQSDIGDIAQAAFQSPQPPPIESVLTGLLNQIAQVPDPIVLVLDDYHVISALAIHNALAFLLENMPLQMHLVLATRADPPLPIPRLRGRGQLVELYQSDLRFTSEEAAEFLNRTMGLDLSVEDVAALERRTEGWIAGLQMAAISMRGHDDLTGFVQAFTGSHRYILDYLGEEVFQRQTRDVQEFLLQTAILGRLSGELCDAVIRVTELAKDRSIVDSQSMLEYLDHDNLFIVPLDDERRWYRYHHLFADLLRQRLQRERHDLVPELHRRASEWYEQNGLTTEAVSHALAAGDLERAACLVEWVAWWVLSRGEMITLLDWLNALPGELVRSRPQLSVLRAWALVLTDQFDGAESCLSDVDVQQVPGEVAAVRAYVASYRDDDIPRAIQLCHQAFEYLPEEKWFSRGMAALVLGFAYWMSCDLAAASRALTEAISLSQATNRTYLTLLILTTLGHVQEMQGLLRQSVETHRQALRLASESGSRPVPFSGMAHVGIAESLYEWNDLKGAIYYAMEGIRLSKLGGRASYVLAGNIVLARVYQAQGDWDSAVEVIQKAEQLLQRHDFVYMRAEVADLRARLWVEQGNIAAASRWARERKLDLVDELSPTLTREVEQIAVARVLIICALYQGLARGSEISEVAETLNLLARLLPGAEAEGRVKNLIKMLALQALALQVQGNLDQALSTLERALSLAEPEGYVRTFVDEGQPMAKLLRHALSQGIAPNYVARLLAAFGEEIRLTSPAMESLVEPLSEREMEVLRLIVAGLSNPEIAEELVIAISTVKSHVNHIYGKLGVKSRTQAVARARELDLLWSQ